MLSTTRSLCSKLFSRAPLYNTAVRRLSIDQQPVGRVGHIDNSEPLSDMISSGTHTSTESITRFMNSVYINKPRTVSLFSFNYRQQTERSNIRGICIGNSGRKGNKPHKNVVIVSGLPLQDPSLIGVGLYVAAVLARMTPALPHDVAVIPLAHPKEYESRWRSPRFGESRGMSGSLIQDQELSDWFPHESETIELKDTCKPIEAYITRRNKYFINIDVNLSAQGASMQYKGNSLTALASKSKFRTFLSERSPRGIPLPLPLSCSSSSSLIPEQPDPLVASLLETPSLVLELKGTQPLDDNQVVARGEEVINMVKQLFAN